MSGQESFSQQPIRKGDGELDFGEDFSSLTIEGRNAMIEAISKTLAQGGKLNPLQQRFQDWLEERKQIEREDDVYRGPGWGKKN